MIPVAWAEFKNFLDIKTEVSPQELSFTNRYLLAAGDGHFVLHCELEKGGSDATDYEANYQSRSNKPVIGSTKISQSDVPVSLRLEGVHFSAPANQVTNHKWKMPKTYRIRGSEFQAKGAKAGDWISLWVRDEDLVIEGQIGNAAAVALYPDYPRLTNYVPKLFLPDNSVGAAPVIDMVDDDTSDPVESWLWIEFELTNTQAGGGNTIEFINNFWMYEDGAT